MSWSARSQTIEVGDKVAYSRTFPRSTGQYTRDVPAAKGIVTALVPLGTETPLAEIEWDKPDLPARVDVNNLCRVNSLEFSD